MKLNNLNRDINLSEFKFKILIILICSMTFFSCMNTAWRGYKEPIENDYRELCTKGNSCMKIGEQNLNERQQKAVYEASTDVWNIIHDDEFKQKVTSKTWLASCELVNGKPDEISGQEVYDILIQKTPKFSIHPRKPHSAIAQTQFNEINFDYNRVAIMPSRIEAWYSNNILTKSELINTIAHELMHIISTKFKDAGHGETCPNNRLVSYEIGNIVELIWICKNQ